MWTLGCAGRGTPLPRQERAPDVVTAATTFCAVELTAPERWQIVLAANDVSGVDCIPPDGAEKFSFGFAHAGWWLQVDIARPTLVVGRAHAFDGQAALLAFGCFEWDGAVTVAEDDAAGWALELDATCRDHAHERIAGAFHGER